MDESKRDWSKRDESKTVLSRAVGSSNAGLDQAARSDLESELSFDRVLAERPGSITYLGHEVGAERPIVLRVRHRAPLEEAGLVADLKAALAEAAALHHPNIVPIQGFGVTDHTVWWTTQFVHAPSLADLLRSDGRLTVDRTVRLASRVVDALRMAHDRGIVHGDVSAGNLLVRGAEWMVLKDFVRPEAWSPGIARAEIAKRSPDADQRALAITIYRCLTGDADRPAAGLLADLASSASLSARLPELPPSAAMALVRAADPDPSRQLTSGTELLAALQAPAMAAVPARAGFHAVLVPEDEPEAQPEPARSGGHRAWLAAALVAAAVVAGLGVTRWVGSSRGRAIPAPLASRDAATPAPEIRPLANAPAPSPPAATAAVAPVPNSAAAPIDSAPASIPDSGVATMPRQRADRPVRRDPPRGSARLSVSSVPGGSLYIDNRLIGSTPRRGLAVTAGRHIIRITRPGYRRYLSLIEVSPGEERRLTGLVLERLQ